MNFLITIAKFATSASVGAVVGNLVGVKTPANAKTITKISLGFGTFILSGMLSDMAMTYVEGQIKTIAEDILRTKIAIETAQKDIQEESG